MSWENHIKEARENFRKIDWGGEPPVGDELDEFIEEEARELEEEQEDLELEERRYLDWKATEEMVSRAAGEVLSAAEAAGWNAPELIYRSRSSCSRYIELEQLSGDETRYLRVRISDHAPPAGCSFDPEAQQFHDPSDVEIIVDLAGRVDMSNLDCLLYREEV